MSLRVTLFNLITNEDTQCCIYVTIFLHVTD
ncbi:hypothetical protein T4D_15837 [Trichinella pseudospiralis]|uniref:Uncharacterized protein n=1 Tax=Trichinella pseudospiralis TaxID=6337 RepID=A0A0V1F8P9_TRIPS|nr:hypothetical protein T4D_15837 [Trichinella pseudospiralis]